MQARLDFNLSDVKGVYKNCRGIWAAQWTDEKGQRHTKYFNPKFYASEATAKLEAYKFKVQIQREVELKGGVQKRRGDAVKSPSGLTTRRKTRRQTSSADFLPADDAALSGVHLQDIRRISRRGFRFGGSPHLNQTEQLAEYMRSQAMGAAYWAMPRGFQGHPPPYLPYQSAMMNGGYRPADNQDWRTGGTANNATFSEGSGWLVTDEAVSLYQQQRMMMAAMGAAPGMGGYRGGPGGPYWGANPTGRYDYGAYGGEQQGAAGASAGRPWPVEQSDCLSPSSTEDASAYSLKRTFKLFSGRGNSALDGSRTSSMGTTCCGSTPRFDDAMWSLDEIMQEPSETAEKAAISIARRDLGAAGMDFDASPSPPPPARLSEHTVAANPPEEDVALTSVFWPYEPRWTQAAQPRMYTNYPAFFPADNCPREFSEYEYVDYYKTRQGEEAYEADDSRVPALAGSASPEVAETLVDDESTPRTVDQTPPASSSAGSTKTNNVLEQNVVATTTFASSS